jgi:hypothetical protein
VKGKNPLHIGFNRRHSEFTMWYLYIELQETQGWAIMETIIVLVKPSHVILDYSLGKFYV